ncbi:MAG: XisH family protein [Limnoraphis robusta]|uniref:XisH protein n=1 Tax=Limnoraphis robusta CS-951 TaxID=1637645 RepID=A0A0F5YJQ3_9CYAN|nr:XisH family protein [Limnoraphis robusta]KKD38420.1 XisH protein [Limnoraphis robusta CS-951]MEA5543090.1 XisH family protein [Limnoraphis robusta Tam1]
MPARDIYHNAVKNALIKEGWTITADPYKILYKDAELFADLAAERPISAERSGYKIVVEIKSFISPSPMRDFENALGQYILYRNLINLTAPDYQIYLAIKESIYENFFKRDSIQEVVQINQILLIVFSIELEEILQWIN